MKFEIKEIGENNKQCSMCAATFEVWLNNLEVDEERKEIIESKLLNYCPACGKADKNN
jgi:hypothetical protein